MRNKLRKCYTYGLRTTYPHNQRAPKLATTFRILAAKGPFPIKSSGKHLCVWAAMFTIPETVKALGPTETNIAGRRFSLGSFCDINRYTKAEYTIRDIRKPTPWIVVPPMMMGRQR